MRNGEIILYQTEDGFSEVSLRTSDGTVWLTQLEIAELFDTSKQNISLHLQNLFADRELSEKSVVKDSLTTASDGKRYQVKFYNLDAILAVGFRVRSPRGGQFRRWAVTGRTAAELIADRSNPTQPHMGLTSWKGSVVRKGDVSTAKNYLKQDEIKQLNRIVTMYLDYAEDQATQRKTITMADWSAKLDTFLQFNERDLLTHAGKIEMAVAKKLAERHYQQFDDSRRKRKEIEADEEDIRELEALTKQGDRSEEGE